MRVNSHNIVYINNTSYDGDKNIDMNLVLNSGYRCRIMRDDSLILIKATSSRVWSWWPIPTHNNDIHSTGYYAGGI